MNFDLTSDQKLLVDSAASFAKKSSPVERARRLRTDPLGFERSVWKQMGALGWLGILFPEELGGFGGTFQDAALVVEQLGRTLVPEPYVEAVVLPGLAVHWGGSAEQKARLLSPVIEGQRMLALAWAERAGRYDAAHVATHAEPAGGGHEITGEKVWVLAGHAADTLLVTARTAGGIADRDGVTLFAIERGAPGVSIQPVATMDGRRAAILRLERVKVGADAVIGNIGGALPVVEDVLDAAATAACAEAVGIAQTVLEMTVDYLKTREQFGVKIGGFQVLQHRAVDMFVQAQLLRSIALEASLRIGSGDRATRQAAVSAAKVQLATGGGHVVKQGIQLHGGIGCTDEHDIGLYFKRMRVLAGLYGDEMFHVGRYASLPTSAA